MKINGISYKGLFKYTSGVEYEKDDFVLCNITDPNTNSTITVLKRVAEDFIATNAPENHINANQLLYYDDVTTSISDIINADPHAPKVCTNDIVLNYVQSICANPRFYNNVNRIISNIFQETTPGVYLVTPATVIGSTLPTYFYITSDTVCRITKITGSNPDPLYIYELFNTKCFFIANSINYTWVDIRAGDHIEQVVQEANQLIASYPSYITALNNSIIQLESSYRLIEYPRNPDNGPYNDQGFNISYDSQLRLPYDVQDPVLLNDVWKIIITCAEPFDNANNVPINLVQYSFDVCLNDITAGSYVGFAYNRFIKSQQVQGSIVYTLYSQNVGANYCNKIYSARVFRYVR